MNNTNDSNRILVGVDGSDASIGALRAGARMATAFNAPLEAIMTWQSPAMMDVFPVGEWSPEGDAKQALSAVIEQAFEGAPPANLSASTIHGAPARVLIDESKNASMLVLGNRGLGGFAGLLIGSVSSACASQAHCPVLIMHEHEGKE